MIVMAVLMQWVSLSFVMLGFGVFNVVFFVFFSLSVMSHIPASNKMRCGSYSIMSVIEFFTAFIYPAPGWVSSLTLSVLSP